MIRVTELHGKGRYINADMIEFIESNPETQLVMTNGRRIFVQETPEEIIGMVIAYKQRCSRPDLCLPTGLPGSTQRKE